MLGGKATNNTITISYQTASQNRESQPASLGIEGNGVINENSLLMRTDEENEREHDEAAYSGPEQVDKLTTRQTVQLSLTFCIIWFLANWSTNASLAYTTVGSSTILSSMSGMPIF
jgi:hypothetical protein